MTETRSHSELMKELHRLLNVIFSDQDSKEVRK